MAGSANYKSTNLDFMRSIAVLLVVGAHSLDYLDHGGHNGWVGLTGVCMFFVHTTLVLMWSLERDDNVGHFYLRRAFRIYPLWLVVFGIILLLRFPQFPPNWEFPHLTHWALVWNTFLLGNIKYGMPYVGASWTLPLEVEMYLFLPFLFYFWRSTRVLWPLFLIDVFLMFFNRYTYPAIYSGLPMCVPYFLPGVIAYALTKKPRVERLPAWLFPVFLLALIAVDIKVGDYRHSWWFCLTLACAIPFFKDMTFAPLRAASHYIAKYSYGIYLTHISVLVIAVHLLRGHSVALRVGVFVVLFCLIPIALYHLVEEPMIRLGSHLARKLKSAKPVPRITEKELELEMAP